MAILSTKLGFRRAAKRVVWRLKGIGGPSVRRRSKPLAGAKRIAISSHPSAVSKARQRIELFSTQSSALVAPMAVRMKGVGIERAAADVHGLIVHGLNTRYPRRAEHATTGSPAESRSKWAVEKIPQPRVLTESLWG